MEQKIIEGNRLIANSPFAEQSDKDHISHYVDSGNEIGLEQYYMLLEYHKNWSRLMPVVEKIEQLGHNVSMWSNRNDEAIDAIKIFYVTRIYKKGDERMQCIGSDNISESRLQSTYQAVIKFITWYNQSK